MSALAQTPLHQWHAEHGGRMVDFAGWSMPVQYSSIVEEHKATREGATLFDVSHMGRLHLSGGGAPAFLNRLLTRRVVDMDVGKIRYSLVTNETGGILDDVLAYRLQKDGKEPFCGLVVNASNREKIVSWIESHLTDTDDVQFEDHTKSSAMIAVQGPRALEIAQPHVGVPISELGYYTGCFATIGGEAGVVSRTGYTGEDGCELIVGTDVAVGLWQSLIDGGAKPAGLGARDTLRLEAAMPLYGHELSEDIDPFQAGLGFAVNLKDRDFVGRDSLEQIKLSSQKMKRVGLEMLGRRVPREHYPVLKNDEQVGEVTSGTFAPTLEKSIAMAYVRPDVAEIGSELAIDIRGRAEPARVVKLPFYKRSV